MLLTETAPYVGPAEVVGSQASAEHIQVELPGKQKTWARLALTMPYSPVLGDELLVISHQDGKTYVIGVLKGQGQTTLRAPGDLNLEAPNGVVNITAPHVHVRAGKLELTTDRIMEKARDVYRWVSGLFQTKAHRMRTFVEKDYHLKAKDAHLKANDDMNIDGKSINLG